jgi:hypothetical protein
VKKLYLGPYCLILLIGNCVAAAVLSRIAEDVRTAYNQLGGGSFMMPGLTRYAIYFPPYFYGFAAVSLLACVALFVRQVPAPLLMHCLLVVAILDCIGLFFFGFGIGLYFVSGYEKIGG